MHHRSAHGSRLAGLAYRAGIPALLATGLAVSAYPVVMGWTSRPDQSRRSAGRALEEARSAGASRWAGRALLDAEGIYREAEAEFRRQELRWLPLRDFRAARDRFRWAEEAAGRASKQAVRFRSESLGTTTRALDVARCMVVRTDQQHGLVRFGKGVGETMRAAKLHLEEAGLLLGEEEYGLARLRADQASEEAGLVRQRMATLLQRFIDPDAVRRWREEEAETVAASATTGKPAIVVNKDEGLLTLYLGGRRVRTYDVEIGLNHLHRKLAAGDLATPEGRYRITAKRGPGRTQYYKALDLDYPNAEDRGRLRDKIEQRVLPAGSDAGEWIEIHGDGGRGRDWTNGCIALRNEDMDDLFARASPGTPVTIIGGDGEGGRFSALARSLDSRVIERGCRYE